VRVSAAGFTPTTSGVQNVTVTGPGITLFSLPTTVGSGLQYGSFSGQLGGSQHGGVTVRVSSNNPGVVQLAKDSSTPGAAFVDIPLQNGDVSFTYWVQGVENATGSATLTASATGFTAATGTVNVVQPGVELAGLTSSFTSLDPNDAFTVRVGAPNGASVTTQSIRPGGNAVTVTIANSSGTVAQLTTLTGSGQSRTVTIGAGQSSSPGTLAAGGIELDPIGGGTSVVSASATGFVAVAGASQTVTVSAPGIQLFSLPTTVGSGLQYGTFSGQLGGSQHSGVNVRLTSSNPAVMRLSPNATTPGEAAIDIRLDPGQVSFSYYLQGMEGAVGGVTLTASAPGFTDATGTVFVAQPGIEIVSLATSTTTLSPSDAFAARVGVVSGSAPNTSVSPAQAIRAGGTSIVVTVTNSTPAVARLVTSAGPGTPRTVTIAPGSFDSPNTVAGGGIELDPLTGGTTTVQASAPGFVQTGTATVQVGVSAPPITLFSLPTTVGAGLQYGSFSGQLGGSEHGGVTVRLTSSNPAMMRLSATATEEGSTFIDIRMNPGDVSFSYWIHGIEGGGLGDATITATAPGFVTATGSVHIVQPALDITSLATSIGATAASDQFLVRIGVPATDGGSVSIAQGARRGTSLTVTVTSSNAAAGQLVTLTGGDASRTIVIAAGSSQTASTVAAGGIEFDPLSGGSTRVTATIPGFVTTDAGNVDVVVTGGAPAPAPEPDDLLAGGAEALAGVLDERVVGRRLADAEELLELRPRVELLHLAGPAQPVGQRGVVAESREVVEEERRRLAAALAALLEL
jgi:hypothetical protein